MHISITSIYNAEAEPESIQKKISGGADKQIFIQFRGGGGGGEGTPKHRPNLSILIKSVHRVKFEKRKNYKL